MSVFNGERSLNKAIESILNQTYKDFEFIIVDDGSSDNSLKIIKEYVKQDNRIKIIKNNVNIGLTKSLNRAIKYSNGEFIARQDADDISLPYRLETQLSYLKNNKKYAFCGTNGFRKQNGQILINVFELDEIKKNLIVENCFIHPSIIIRKETLKKYGVYNEQYLYAQDYELWCRLIYKYKINGINLREKLIIRDKSFGRFLKRDKKKFYTQKLNCINIRLKYIKYTRYKFSCLVSILIYWVEILTLCSLLEFFKFFFNKINF